MDLGNYNDNGRYVNDFTLIWPRVLKVIFHQMAVLFNCFHLNSCQPPCLPSVLNPTITIQIICGVFFSFCFQCTDSHMSCRMQRWGKVPKSGWLSSGASSSSLASLGCWCGGSVSMVGVYMKIFIHIHPLNDA